MLEAQTDDLRQAEHIITKFFHQARWGHALETIRWYVGIDRTHPAVPVICSVGELDPDIIRKGVYMHNKNVQDENNCANY